MIVYYFLSIIVFLGIITSYQDIKIGKIRNKWILLALVFSFIMNIILFFSNSISGNEILLLLSNLGITIIFSFILWNFSFWSAGDAKLFIAYVALIPIGFYTAPFFRFFAAFDLFLNMIVLFFAYILIRKIIKIPLTKIKSSFLTSIKTFPELFISLFALRWIIYLIMPQSALTNTISIFIVYAAVYFVVNIIITQIVQKTKNKKIKNIYFYLALLLAGIIVQPKTVLNLSGIFSVLISAIMYSLILRTIYKIANEHSHKKVRISRLKEGDVLARTEKTEIFRYVSASAEGLEKKDIAKIRKLSKSGKMKSKTVDVAETIAFAPAMFIGVIVTLVFGNIANIINLVIYLFLLVF